MLDAAGISYFHSGIEPISGVPLGKPHDSVERDGS
jgi:hypothetical protein